jgi:hypothetical protein
VSGFYTYEFPTLEWGEVTYQPIEQVYTGSGHFEFSVMSSQTVNTPVVGICLLQARMGYILSPLEYPLASAIPLASADTAWKGQEERMFNVLRQALESHVAQVANLSI